MKIIDKLLSGRFVMVLLFSTTVCIGFLKKLISADAILPIMILIAEWYFNRNDREKKE